MYVCDVQFGLHYLLARQVNLDFLLPLEGRGVKFLNRLMVGNVLTYTSLPSFPKAKRLLQIE